MGTNSISQDDAVDLSSTDGVSFIVQSTPLTRLHYFDGKFLRADAFTLEQDYNRTTRRLANLAGGWGVVSGLGVSIDTTDPGLLDVSAGLAVTAAGNFVYAVGDIQATLADLLAVATPAPIGGNADFGNCAAAPKAGVTQATGFGIYEITVGPVEGLCGNEAVFGKICESACVSDSQRPYWREGVVLRLRPITLQLATSSAVTLTTTHLRNRVASAYFAAEPWLTPSALSASGLDSDLWCYPATLYSRDEVVIGLLVRDATATRVIDAWSGRRERMDTQARGYWQGRMAMRPWNVFTAQVLQFQCQLVGLFDGTGGTTGGDDCDQIRQLLDSTRTQIDALHKRYSDGALRILQKFGNKPSAQDAQSMITEIKGSYADLYQISSQLAGADLGAGPLPVDRQLLQAGFVELPPAGYLPVVPGQQPLADQLSRMFGEGVDLAYHAVRHDEIAHLVEEAQHMDRISLTRGLDDPTQLEQVEIFVPDGTTSTGAAAAPGTWWEMNLSTDFFVSFEVDLGLTSVSYTSQLAGGPAPAPPGLFGASPMAMVRNRLIALARGGAGQASAPAPAASPAPAPRGSRKRATAAVATSRQTIAVSPVEGDGDDLPLPDFTGLVRTGPGDTGGFAFTLVLALDTGSSDGVGGDATALAQPRQQIGVIGDRLMAIYIGADLSADPFTLAKGAQAQIKAEMRSAADVLNLNGSLTVMGDVTQADGSTARIVQVDVTITANYGGITRETGAIALRRTGDAANGSYVLDGSPHVDSRSPLEFDWSSNPRLATAFVLDLTKQIVITGQAAQGRQVAVGGGSGLGGSGDGSTSTGTPQPLLEMRGLPAMPDLADPLGAAAMNLLIRLGDLNDDDAFVARARDRLFPSLATPPDVVVSVVLDWVMFRRRRTPLCCPPVTAPAVAAAVDAFEVWHYKAKNQDDLALLTKALDKGGTKALQPFAFRQVGVLRYGDADTTPLEPPQQVLDMWDAIASELGAQVVLGRYWEDSPPTGQGWQNNFRLTALLRQISGLTKPPAAGSGAIAALANLSPPLYDTGLDGGMLVVTMAVPVVRKALLAATTGFQDPGTHPIDASPTPAAMSFSDNVPVGADLANFLVQVKGAPGSIQEPVIGVVLETTAGTPDPAATTRAQAIKAALVAAGLADATLPVLVNQISQADTQAVAAVNLAGIVYDDVIFIERQQVIL